jgi:hypothetical protein
LTRLALLPDHENTRKKRVLLNRTADSAIIILVMKCDRRHIIASRLAGKIGRQGDL